MSEAIICDICGKTIQGKYEDIRIFEENNKSLLLAGEMKHIELCPRCYKKVELFLKKEREGVRV